jgi:hypothetical protein
MENIIRSLGAGTLTVAYNLAGASNFTAIDIARAVPYRCNQRRFPIFLGSTAGITHISIFKFDHLGNIGLAGRSTDSQFLTNSGNYFVGLLEYQGFNFTWVYELGG